MAVRIVIGLPVALVQKCALFLRSTQLASGPPGLLRARSRQGGPVVSGIATRHPESLAAFRIQLSKNIWLSARAKPRREAFRFQSNMHEMTGQGLWALFVEVYHGKVL